MQKKSELFFLHFRDRVKTAATTEVVSSRLFNMSDCVTIWLWGGHNPRSVLQKVHGVGGYHQFLIGGDDDDLHL